MNLTLGGAFLELLHHPEYQQALGVILVFSMIIGTVLDGGRRNLIHWSLAVLLCMVALEYTRWIYWEIHGGWDVLIQGRALTFAGVFVYLLGVFIGWAIAWQAKKAAHRKLLVERIKESERIQNGSLIEKS